MKPALSRSEASASQSMRDLILDHATHAFATKEYHGVKISRLCKDAGIANGTFYIYFRDKDALYQAVMQRAVDEFLLALRTAEETGSDGPAQADLRDLDIIVRFATAQPQLLRALFNDRGLRGEGGIPIRSLMVRQRATIVEDGQANDVFRSDIDPELAARAEIAVTAELLVAWLDDPERLSREDLIAQLHGFRMRLLRS